MTQLCICDTVVRFKEYFVKNRSCRKKYYVFLQTWYQPQQKETNRYCTDWVPKWVIFVCKSFAVTLCFTCRFQHANQEFAFLKYFERIPPLEKQEDIYGFESLKWATGNAMDYKFCYDNAASDKIEAEQCYSFVSFLKEICLPHF